MVNSLFALTSYGLLPDHKWPKKPRKISNNRQHNDTSANISVTEILSIFSIKVLFNPNVEK